MYDNFKWNISRVSMIRKSKYHRDFTWQEIEIGYSFMMNEIMELSNRDQYLKIDGLFSNAWKSFVENEWSYDGATFVKERNPLTIFEVAAFIHDWRNFKGYVGKEIDNEFLCIMIVLNYKPKLIIKRWLFMRLTFLNKIRHKIKGTLNNNLTNQGVCPVISY